VKRFCCITIALLLAGAMTARGDLYCDGDPPKLINKDSKGYTYEIKCRSKTEKREIEPGSKQELKGKSGCQIKLGDDAEKLFTEMVCTIKAGKLSCDLI
jgi:hypothetical protein